MKKLFLRFIYIAVFCLMSSTNIYASAPVKDDQAIHSLLRGRVLIIDMDINDEFGKQTFLSGKDLILVKVMPILPLQKNDPLRFEIVALSKPEELTNIDLNHDGIISKDEMAKANIALLRYNHSGDIIIDPLGVSLIQQVNYVKHKDGSLDITLLTKDDKRFKGYFINL